MYKSNPIYFKYLFLFFFYPAHISFSLISINVIKHRAQRVYSGLQVQSVRVHDTSVKAAEIAGQMFTFWT